MAIVSFANLDQNFSISDTTLTDFTPPGSLSPGWTWVTPDGHRPTFEGTGLFTTNGRPTGGTVNSFSLKLYDPNLSQPDLTITGVSFDFVRLSDVADPGLPPHVTNAIIWLELLSGDDAINFGTNATTGNLNISFAGDGVSIGYSSQDTVCRRRRHDRSYRLGRRERRHLSSDQ